MADRPAPSRKGDDGVNVQVLLRCRPLATNESKPALDKLVDCDERQGVVTVPNVGKTRRQFHFDKVFGPQTSQAMLYEQGIQPVVKEVLDGFNCTIFAYGQTGTGKTYTMEGGMRDSVDGSELSLAAGVIPRAINQIFEHVRGISGDLNTVKCSFLELYNEEATDLLAVGETSVKLAIQADPSQKGGESVMVKGLEEVCVSNAADIYALLDRGSAKRRTAATLLNKQSSRSHSVFCVTVQIHEMQNGEDAIRIGKLYLVDLAGSESIFRSGATEERAKEAGSINKSLSALGRVINAIVDKTGHIPYRDSKLTRLLADSLGGRTKTCIIATISPTLSDETKNTLEYALRAKNIRNRPEVNQKVSSATHMANLSTENKRLKMELAASREKDGVFMPLAIYEKEQEDAKADKERLAEVEAVLEAKDAKHAAAVAALDQQLASRQAELEATQQQLNSTQAALQQAKEGLRERDFFISAHGRAEDRLVGTARGLRSQLATAAAELLALFASVDAKTALEGCNASCVRELQGLVASKLQVLEATVDDAMVAQQAKFGAITQQLGAAAECTQAAAADLQQQTAELSSQLAVATAATVKALDDTADAAAEGFQAAQAAHGDHMRAAEAAAASATQAHSAAHSRLCAGLQQQAERLTACAAALSAEDDAAAVAILDSIRAGSGSLQEVGACATAWQEDGSAKAAELRQELASHEAAAQGSLATGLAELKETFGGLLESFAAKHKAQTAASTEALQQRLAAAEAASAGHGARLAQVAGAASQQLQEGKDAFTAARQQQSEMRTGWFSGLQTDNSVARSCGDEVKSEAEAGLLAQLQRQRSLVESSAAAAAADEARVCEAAGAGKADCTSASEALEAGHGSLLAVAQDSLRAADGAMSGVGAAAKEASRLATGLLESHGGSCAALGSGVANLIKTKYRDGISTVDLPPRRQIAVPSEERIDGLRAPSPEAALAEFRRSQAVAGAGAADSPDAAEAQEQQAGSPSEAEEPPAVGAKRVASSGPNEAASPLQARDPNRHVSHVQQVGKRRRTEEVA